MKKLIFGFLLLIIFCYNVNASTYIGWNHIDVDVLPDASADTLNNIYDYDDKYFVTEKIITDYSKFGVGDVFDHNTMIYFYDSNLKSNLVTFLSENGYNSSRNYYKLFDYSFSSYTFSFSIYYSNDTLYCTYFSKSLIQYTETLKFVGDDRIDFSFYYDLDSVSYSITKIYSDYPSSVFFSQVSSVSYRWLEISYYDWYEFTSKSTDLYLFYNYSDICSFDIFSWVDFTTFTDFQKVVVVISVNIFFCIFLLFIVYIFIKLFNKLVSWLFR